MSRKMLITSMLLVVGYSVVCHFSNEVKVKNEALKGLFSEILEREIETFEIMKYQIDSESRKSESLQRLSESLLGEAEVIMSSINRSEYKNSEYVENLFTKFNIDLTLINKNLSINHNKYQLYQSVNQYLYDHYKFLDKHQIEIAYTKLRLLNRRDTYELNDLHRLDFQFYNNYIYGNGVKYYYEIDGERKRLRTLPLILYNQPSKIDFETEFTDLVTGEIQTYKSQYTP